MIATVLTPREFEPPKVSRIEEVLQKEVDPRVHLVLRSIISRDADRNDPVFVVLKELERREEIAKQTDFLNKASKILNAQLAQVSGTRLIDVYRDTVQGQTTVTAVVRSPAAIEPVGVAKIQEMLQKAVGMPVGLVVRSMLTRDADAHRYIYDTEKEESKPLTCDALKFHDQIEAALKSQLKRRDPDASLVDLQYAERNGRLELLAVVRTPWQIAPAKVKQIEQALRRYGNARTDLVMRSIVGVDASATKYFSASDGAPSGVRENRE